MKIVLLTFLFHPLCLHFVTRFYTEVSIMILGNNASTKHKIHEQHASCIVIMSGLPATNFLTEVAVLDGIMKQSFS